MRMVVDLQTVDGRRDMKTIVDIDETRLKIPLGDVIGLSLNKVENKIRGVFGLDPKDFSTTKQTKEEPKTKVKTEQKTAPIAETKGPVVGHPSTPAKEEAKTPPAEKPIETPITPKTPPEKITTTKPTESGGK